jgi:hypothetical protein
MHFMFMQKAMSNQNVQTKTLVEVSPAVLREVADRLENTSKSAMPGQTLTLPFTNSIWFQFNPEIPSHSVLNIRDINATVEPLAEPQREQMVN